MIVFTPLLPISALMTASRHRFSTALYERFSSRGEDDFADKLLSAMRYQFGGHPEKPTDKSQGRLNVVFNHAAEGDQRYVNYSGHGLVFNSACPAYDPD